MLDVDGTTVPNRQDGMPSQKVTEAIMKAKEKIHIGLVTGRSIPHLAHIFDYLQLSGPSIINGGTKIIDSVSRKTLWEQPISLDDFATVLLIAKRYHKRVWVNNGEKDFPLTKRSMPQKPFGVFLLRLTLDEANKLEKEISVIPTVFLHKMISWTPRKIDVYITHASATKQHAILNIARILGIRTRDIIGVGDGYNDFPLLMACGLKVAMGNAVSELKEIADYIAPSIDEDGVANVIEKFVL